MYDAVKYRDMKRAYRDEFRRMRPAENATQEMKDAFSNALEDFYLSEEDFAA